MKNKNIVLPIILFFLITFSLFGHSGRTDSNGGHYNRTTGVYHNHNHTPWGVIIIVSIIIIVVAKNSGRNRKL